MANALSLVGNYYITVTSGAGETVVATDFYAPSKEAAVIMARSYVRSLVAHTKKSSTCIKKEMCKLHKK